MYAVIETGGKQVRVREGGTVRVESLAAAPGDEVTFDRILLVGGGGGTGGTQVGTPVVTGAVVRARVLRQGRSPKIRVMKYKAKAHYRRRSGHRQGYTELRIERIDLPGRDWAESAQPAPEGGDATVARPRRRKTGGA